jgi:hypothetical protein
LRRAVFHCPESSGTGVDNNLDMLNGWQDAEKCEQICCDLEEWIDLALSRTFASNDDKYDAIFCIGALPQGHQKAVIEKLKRILNPNGRIIIGELVWIVDSPSQEFLSYCNLKAEDYFTQESLLDAVRGDSNSFHILLTDTVLMTAYETALLHNVEKWALNNSSDEDANKILAMSREWIEFGQRIAWSTWAFCTVVGIKINN